MKKFILSFLIVLISSSIQSFAQIGDSLTCYTNTELQRIASRVLRAKECDTLLIIANDMITNQQLMINNQDLIITSKDVIINNLNDNISSYQLKLTFKDNEIALKNKELRHYKFKLIGTNVLLVGVIAGLILL